jgi:hypothetical protein
MRAGLDSHQQRLRLRDLRHFVRRRETFERRREDGPDAVDPLDDIALALWPPAEDPSDE